MTTHPTTHVGLNPRIRPKPKNFYEVDGVQIRVFENAVQMWMQLKPEVTGTAGVWYKRTIQMRKITKINEPMLDQYDLVTPQGNLVPSDIERKHFPDEVLAVMDGAIKKAHVLWLLHQK